MDRLIDNVHIVTMIQPGANALAGTKTGTAVSMKNYERLHIVIPIGAGATGTSKLTVEACSASDGTGATAIPYERIKQAPAASPVDTWGDYADVTAVGEDTPAGANKLLVLEVLNRQLPEGKFFVRLKSVEQVVSAVDACVIGILSHPRYQQIPQISALS